MSQIQDHNGRTVIGVRIGKPFDIKYFRESNPNDLKAVDHTSNNSLLFAIVANNYNGTVTLPSGEKYKIETIATKGSKMLLTQTKLHTHYKNKTVQLIPVSARYVEISLQGPAVPVPMFTETDFPQL